MILRHLIHEKLTGKISSPLILIVIQRINSSKSITSVSILSFRIYRLRLQARKSLWLFTFSPSSTTD